MTGAYRAFVAAGITVLATAVIVLGAALIGVTVARTSEPGPAIIVTPHPIPRPGPTGGTR